MPELPEVEALVRGIRSELVGMTFTNVHFLRDDVREKIPKKRIKDILLNKKVLEVMRRGKYLLVGTDVGFLGVHLGMSGRLVKTDPQAQMQAHTHAVFEVGAQIQYRFIDPRRFGRLFAVGKNEMATHPFLAQLGVEPLDHQIDLPGHLFVRSRRKAQPIKSFLMNHEVIVGVGNIYASEALWLAEIHPSKPAGLLSQDDYVRLASAVAEVLHKAIKAGGTTLRDYRNQDDHPGDFQTKLAVYGKDGASCQRCHGEILRTVHSGRSTFHCPFCQSIKN